MSEQNEGGSFAAASSGKSPEEIAFELVNKLKGQGVWGERNLSAILDMYAECLDAAKGLRSYAGQNRVDAPVKAPVGVNGSHSAQPRAAQPVAAAAPPQAQPAHHPATPQPMQAQPQPVQVQQAALQQAFRQT